MNSRRLDGAEEDERERDEDEAEHRRPALAVRLRRSLGVASSASVRPTADGAKT